MQASDSFAVVICEKNAGETRCQSCGGKGVEIGFSHRATSQKQGFGGLEHSPRSCKSTSRFDISTPQIAYLTVLI
jgi:hypothetical protein